jgi:chemotaxis protein MotB
MMSLLLCFFVLLAAFSELKQEDKFQEVINAIREAFGYSGGSGMVPGDEMPVNSIVQKIQETSLSKGEKFKQISEADDPGVYGRQTTVKRIREGVVFTIGGLITFEPGSADLKEGAAKDLARIAEIIRGKNNKVEIRGHVTGDDLISGNVDPWDLSYQRAKVVMEFLTAAPQNIRSDRLRVIGCGDKEPIVHRVYDKVDKAVNRRVEIIVTEALVQDLQPTDNRTVSAVTE